MPACQPSVPITWEAVALAAVAAIQVIGLAWVNRVNRTEHAAIADKVGDGRGGLS